MAKKTSKKVSETDRARMAPDVALPDNSEIVPIDRIIPHPRNSKKHPKKQVSALADSLQSFGQAVPIIVHTTGAKLTILRGHGIYAAAKSINMSHLSVIRNDNLTEEQRRAYMLADNRLAELSCWDEDSLAFEYEFFAEKGFDTKVIGFTPEELARTCKFDSDRPESSEEVFPENQNLPEGEPETDPEFDPNADPRFAIVIPFEDQAEMEEALDYLQDQGYDRARAVGGKSSLFKKKRTSR